MSIAASSLVVYGIPSLALLALTLVTLALAKLGMATRAVASFAAGACAWLVVTAVLARTGMLVGTLRDGTPLMLALFVPTLGLPIALGLSHPGRVLATAPTSWLVGFHAFRLPLELVMHRAATEGVMPPQMTFTGANLDIITGLVAIPVAALAARGKARRGLVLAFNLLGSLLLLIVMAVALASLPRFAVFGSDAAHLNTWVMHFPFVWLPAGLVTSALLGHVVLWRRQLGSRQACDATR